MTTISDDLTKHRIFVLRLITSQTKPIQIALRKVQLELLKPSPSKRQAIAILEDGVNKTKAMLQAFSEYENKFINKLAKKYKKKSKSVEVNTLAIKVKFSLSGEYIAINKIYDNWIKTQIKQLISFAEFNHSKDNYKEDLDSMVRCLNTRLHALQKTTLNAVANYVVNAVASV